MKKSILIVDDDPSICEYLTDLFQTAPYHLDVAHSGTEALAAIDQSPPDLVLTDVVMAKMGGLRLIQEIRNRGYHFPILVFSGYFDDGIETTLTKVGGNDFLAKPFNRNHLIRKIETHLETQTAVKKAAL